MELIESLKQVELMDLNILVPGHGPISNKDAVREHREYLQDLATEVKCRERNGFRTAEAGADR